MNQSKANAIQTYLRQTEQRLAQAGFPEAAREARLLLAHLLCQSPAAVPLWPGSLAPAQQAALEGYVLRRLAGEPLQYVLGETEFMSLPFAVNPAVLIPRGDTERIVEAAIARLRAWPGPLRIADLCCGSGAIGVSIAKLDKDAKVTCADVSAKALAVAKKNAAANGCKGVKFVESDLFAASDFHGRFGKGKYQLIISNPPYIRHDVIDTLEPEVRAHEPMLALDGGADGLEFYRRIIAEAPGHLKKNGVLMMEIGYDQKDAVKELLRESGRFEKIVGLTDLTGKDRIVAATVITVK